MRLSIVMGAPCLALLAACSTGATSSRLDGHGHGQSSQQVPACTANNGGTVAINDAQMVQWEETAHNQFTARGHASGTLTEVLPVLTGHDHFNVQIGGDDTQVIEVIYETQYGALPTLQLGMQVEACGDFIKVVPGSSGTTGDAPAILHWVHAADGGSHPDGYVAVDGVVYGLN